MKYNSKYMDLAYEEALKAFNNNEIPVGCIIVKDDKVISSGYNLKEFNNCVIDHAEMICIKKASERNNNWRLDDCNLYVTLDPCPMCASAIKQARIKNVYSGCSTNENDNKLCKEIFNIVDRNKKVNFTTNLDYDRCKKLLDDFFDKRRNN